MPRLAVLAAKPDALPNLALQLFGSLGCAPKILSLEKHLYGNLLRHDCASRHSVVWCCGSHSVELSAFAFPAAAVPAASAQPCPDTEVVFARGTGEPPGVGPPGQAFVDAIGGSLGGKSMDVYPVNYPASDQWSTGLDGIRDAGA